MTGHIRDGIGICIRCNRCTDPTCCPPADVADTCDRRTEGPLLRAMYPDRQEPS